jgi:hypothetical protein
VQEVQGYKDQRQVSVASPVLASPVDRRLGFQDEEDHRPGSRRRAFRRVDRQVSFVLNNTLDSC